MTRLLLNVCLFSVFFCSVYSAPADEHELDCPENEYYEKCSLIVCQKHCRELLVPFPCPGVLPSCYAPACICKQGYLRSDKGICVPVEKCEKTCKENEEYHDCIYSICRQQQCGEIGSKCYPRIEKYCEEGCVCKENFLRYNGKCVLKDQCITDV